MAVSLDEFVGQLADSGLLTREEVASFVERDAHLRLPEP